MIIALLIAGIGFLLAGLLGIAYGIPIKEFSFGNTMIIAGAITACTGMIMIALCVVVRELKAVAEHLQTDGALAPRSGSTFPVPAPMPVAGVAPRDQMPGNDAGMASSADADPSAPPSAPPPWHEETASRDRSRSETPPVPPVEAPAPKRRNLLFSSTSRKERERAEARTAEAGVTDARTPPMMAPPVKPSEPSPATFEDAWPQPDRAKTPDTPPRRSGRTPSTFAEPTAATDRPAPPASPPARREEPQAVSVLKSGVVDGMAYSLYSDGSIEAQMPEGMMRFASIDELRAHLDQRT
jgi:hypothetical protein